MRRSRLMAVIIATTAIIIAAMIGVYFAFTPAPYHVADRYRLHSPLNNDELIERLVRDGRRDELVQGLSIDEIRERFRGIPIGGPPNKYQRDYDRPGLLWIGDTPFCIEMEGGRGVHIWLKKG